MDMTPDVLINRSGDAEKEPQGNTLPIIIIIGGRMAPGSADPD